MAFAILKKEKLSFSILPFLRLPNFRLIRFLILFFLIFFRNNKLTSLNETVDFSAAEIVDFSFNNLSCIPDLQKSAQLILLHGNPINCGIENFEPFFGFSSWISRRIKSRKTAARRMERFVVFLEHFIPAFSVDFYF